MRRRRLAAAATVVAAAGVAVSLPLVRRPSPAPDRPRRPAADGRPHQPPAPQPPRRRGQRRAAPVGRRRRDVLRVHSRARQQAAGLRAGPGLPVPHRDAGPRRQRHGAVESLPGDVATDDSDEAPHRRRRRRGAGWHRARHRHPHPEPARPPRAVAGRPRPTRRVIGRRAGRHDGRLQRRLVASRVPRRARVEVARCPRDARSRACRAHGRPTSGTRCSRGTRRSSGWITRWSTTASSCSTSTTSTSRAATTAGSW